MPVLNSVYTMPNECETVDEFNKTPEFVVGLPFIYDSLYIDYSNIIDGLGVFTNRDLAAGHVVEISRIISVDSDTHRSIRQPFSDYLFQMDECRTTSVNSDTQRSVMHPFFDYFFQMDESRTTSGLALGFGSLYNHSQYPNVCYQIDHDRELIMFTTLQRITAGSELYISYGERWWSTRKRVPVGEMMT